MSESLINDTPYMHLKKIVKIKPTWKDLFTDHNVHKRQKYGDAECTYVEPQTHKIFNNLGLCLTFGVISSWPSRNESDTKEYHIDSTATGTGKLPNWSEVGDYSWELGNNISYFAINVLLQGSVSKTEWAKMERCTLVTEEDLIKFREIQSKAGGYAGLTKNRYYDITPDWSCSIMPDHPMMINIQVPHRVVANYKGDVRWTYSIRCKTMDYKPVPWKQGVTILQRYALQ